MGVDVIHFFAGNSGIGQGFLHGAAQAVAFGIGARRLTVGVCDQPIFAQWLRPGVGRVQALQNKHDRATGANEAVALHIESARADPGTVGR